MGLLYLFFKSSYNVEIPKLKHKAILPTEKTSRDSATRMHTEKRARILNLTLHYIYYIHYIMLHYISLRYVTYLELKLRIYSYVLCPHTLLIITVADTYGI